jgi:anti-anti-sigma factor
MSCIVALDERQAAIRAGGFVRSQLCVREQPLGGSVRLLALRGELDQTTAAGLVVKLKRGVPQRRPGVIVDLTELTSLDAIGVGLLQDSQLRLAGAEGCLAVVSPEPHHSRLIPESATLDVFRSRAEAIVAVHRIVLMRPRAVRSVLDVPAG